MRGVFPLLLALSFSPVCLAQAGALLHERAILIAADDICSFFSPDEKRALESGYWQARGALLRAGAPLHHVTGIDVESRARARKLGCAHPMLVNMSDRLRDAFTAFARLSKMEYAAAHHSWIASRVASGWLVAQKNDEGGQFGLYLHPGQSVPRLTACLPSQDGRRSRAGLARLRLRDAQSVPKPWIGDVFGHAQALHAPPRAVTRPFWAEKRSRIDGCAAWVFPEQAADLLARLDPRETAVVEIIDASNWRPIHIWVVEVGDYRAAASFAAIALDAGRERPDLTAHSPMTEDVYTYRVADQN